MIPSRAVVVRSLKFLNHSQQPARYASHFTFAPSKPDPSLGTFTPKSESIQNDSVLGETTSLNLCQAVNHAMDTALADDKSACVFGEDVAFGGVFRCSLGLQDKYGNELSSANI